MEFLTQRHASKREGQVQPYYDGGDSMAVAPEPYLAACLAVLGRAIVFCRACSRGGEWSAEHFADLMDAIHNLPWWIENWEKCDVELLRRGFLQEYERKWLGRGGLALCQIFDEVVARKEKG
jgi:hypothetical protein